MLTFLTFVIILQVILFHIDEYVFHRKRKITRPEVVSALIDGVTYVIPLCLAMFIGFTPVWGNVYIALATISCISVAKNEFYYPKLRRKERMVHSFLYVLHPVVLYAFYISWQGDYFNKFPSFWIIQIIYLGLGLRSLAHQVIYWNYIYTDELHTNPQEDENEL